MRTSIQQAIDDKLPFAIYRLPGEQQVNLVIQQSDELPFHPFEKMSDLEGFLVAPFRGQNINHTLCLRPDVHIATGMEEFRESFQDQTAGQFVDPDRTGEYVMTKAEYLERAAFLVELLRDGQLRKVVMSRVMEHTLASDLSVGRFLDALMRSNPNAFVYLVRLPGHGTWTGATPELLFMMGKDHAETVALAGTRPADNIDWTEKEVKEQRIVMDYIEELLFQQKVTEYARTGPVTAGAGNIVHLKTTYELSISQTQHIVGQLIAGLHPTPAVCGLPRNKAYQLIRKVEKHERGFYAGFIGPWNVKGSANLYVNLRCAEIFNDRISLFVGGGLTAESRPEEEWDETVRKSHTLLSVLEKI